MGVAGGGFYSVSDFTFIEEHIDCSCLDDSVSSSSSSFRACKTGTIGSKGAAAVVWSENLRGLSGFGSISSF